ncbi:molybdopterin-guanine dinucleotide biosynthesis protein B [Natrinema thermotolerans]|uniref:Molybdopterin-guanine dinucleotide biosynthesis protein B n=1 Tax=Natrinema thermotolerans TaxID=121872 RepID=A0AAF0PCG2_9EURY|nr:molybdopterin-guanine dinucleotide biosynthesis protein B [Natrinema thermotolerans]QCC57522.1 molybdopterin-guanine dinucleotide biosynthesis protein B [Natrinema thermotolerans]WMT08601.1 molybdopterin-guanine dinucleotide biosynthesis protein B [Natrinema thermotolerans]
MSQDSRLRVVCLAGPSDAGKTSLVERLVPRLAADGRVATVKSIHHDIEIDTPGTDTHRHRSAGAETVVGVTPELTFDITARGKRNPPEPTVDEPLLETDDPELRALSRTLERLADRGYDTVIVEGFADASVPTILVGDRGPEAVGGSVIGRGDDPIDDLLESIRSLEGHTVPAGGGRTDESAD